MNWKELCQAARMVRGFSLPPNSNTILEIKQKKKQKNLKNLIKKCQENEDKQKEKS